MGVLFIVLLGPLDRRLEMVHSNDFSGIWSGPATVLVGVNPWDPNRYVPTAVALGTKTPEALAPRRACRPGPAREAASLRMGRDRSGDPRALRRALPPVRRSCGRPRRRSGRCQLARVS